MLARRLLPLACFVLFGCDPDSESVGVGPDSTSGGSGSGGSESSDGTTGGSISGTSMGGSTGGSSGPDDTGEASTGVLADCDLEAIVCEGLENGMVPPDEIVDCGSVELDDPPEAYQAVRDCILQASAAEQTYKGFAAVVGIDSQLVTGYSSTAGAEYVDHRWLSDIGLGFGSISEIDCPPNPVIPDDPDCVPGPMSGLCLGCEGESVQVCAVRR